MVKKLAALFVFSLFIVSCTSCVTLPWASSDQHAYPTDSFVKMQTKIDDQVVSSGSGAVIQHTEQGSIVLTAGHICVNPQLEMFAILEGKEATLQAHGQDTEVITVDTDLDVCLVKVSEGLEARPPLSISHEGPELQEQLFTVSSPTGLADQKTGLVGMFEGLYIGNTDVLGVERSVFSIPSTGGSSGAPILNSDNKIVSITTHANPQFEHLTIGPRHDKFFAFVAEAMIPYSNEYTKEDHLQD